jgi:ribosome-binding protein aMBF1 (putative translation factor)
MHLIGTYLSTIRYSESARVINQAIDTLGLGKKGLAEKLNKDPSLISRYANGIVRPKAETLLECMKFIDNNSGIKDAELLSEHDAESLKVIKESINQLSPLTDIDLIQTILKVLKLAKKI